MGRKKIVRVLQNVTPGYIMRDVERLRKFIQRSANFLTQHMALKSPDPTCFYEENVVKSSIVMAD